MSERPVLTSAFYGDVAAFSIKGEQKSMACVEGEDFHFFLESGHFVPQPSTQTEICPQSPSNDYTVATAAVREVLILARGRACVRSVIVTASAAATDHLDTFALERDAVALTRAVAVV